MRTYTDLDLEIIGNQLGMMLGMKRTHDGLWLLTNGTKTGLGLVRTLASILRDVECGCLEEGSAPMTNVNGSSGPQCGFGLERWKP